jgi:hypothetical protein
MSEKSRFCHLCGARLAGSYVLYQSGLVCCEECERTAPRCSLCGLPSRSAAPVCGQTLCPPCRARLPVCRDCGLPILGRYLDIEGSLLCEPCAHTAPRCARCGLPHPRLSPVRDLLACPACLQQAIVCACCRVPIVVGSSTKLGDSPLSYCESCLQNRPRCGVCSAPLDERGVVLEGSDGSRCASCYSTAVRTEREAEQLYREAYASLKGEVGLDLPDEPPPLHLVGRTTLVELHRRTRGTAAGTTPPPAGDEYHLHGCLQQVGEQLDTYIERFLPRSLFLAVAAHELGHEWQVLHAPRTQSRTLVEGFAHWVAWRVLLARGEVREAARLTRGDDHYSEGLQVFISLENQHGRAGAIRQAARLVEVPQLP